MIKPKPSKLLETTPPRFGYYELLIFLFLLFKFLVLTSEKSIDPNVKTYYLLTYEFGLGSRMLIGSIFSLFTDYITDHVIYISGIMAYAVLIILISLLLGCIIRTSLPAVRPSIIIFIVLFLVSPLSVTHLLGGYFGRFDIYWIIITLLGLLFLKKRVLQWFLPLLCGIAILVNQAYLLTYMPALAIPILYEVYKSKYSKKMIAILGASCMAMIILFLIFQFCPIRIPYDNAVDFAKYLSKNAGFSPSVIMLHFNYFSNTVDDFINYVFPLMSYYALPFGLALLTSSAPFLIIFGYIWKKSSKSTDKKILKLIYFFCAAAVLVFIPAALFGNDWDRWWAAVINNQFILIFYFIYSKEATVIKYVVKAGDFLSKHFLLLLVIIVFSNSLSFSAASNLQTYIKDLGKVFQFNEDYLNKYVYGVLTGG